MATSEETRFALGVLVAIVVVSLAAFALQFVNDSESTQEKPARASSLKSEPPRSSKVAANTHSSQSAESLAQPVALSTRTASATSATASLLANTDTQPVTAIPVIDPVPLEFFDTTGTASQSPNVIKKYRDRVARGALFMARLEDIVTDNAPASSDNQHNLSMEFTARSKSKQLSFKSVHVTNWIEATFNSDVLPATADVLVDVRRVDETGSEGERVALFFASVQDHAGKRGFAMNADVGDNNAIVRVYAVTDLLHQLGEARLTPADISD